MPNWCENNLSITGNKEELDRLVEYVKGEDESFSFHAILPIPKELQGTQSPANIVTQKEYDNIPPELWAKMIDPNNPFESIPITTKMSKIYIMEYGNDNWYDWSCDNWGTKWDTRHVEMQRSSPTELSYFFDTAWSPPEGIYKELVNQFPTLRFTLQWSEEGGEFGTIRDTDDIPERETTRAMHARIEALLTNMSEKGKFKYA